MTRLKQAWLALCGREPEVRTQRVEVPVVGERHVTSVYVVSVPVKDGGSIQIYSGGIIWLKHDKRYYTSCEQAYSEHPGEYVKQERAIRIGSRYFLVGELLEVEPQPKPKIAKGKRK